MVCRVFQKSAGAKKFPSNQSRAVNPYSLEIGPSVLPSQMLQAAAETYHHHFPINGRTYMPTAADHQLAELTRMLRGGGGGAGGASSAGVNLPIQPQMNYPLAGGFTISGLNLNLGGGAAAAPPVLRPMPPPTQPMNPQDVNVTANTFAGPETGYGADISNSNAGGNRYMSMENCMDLDSYWPSY